MKLLIVNVLVAICSVAWAEHPSVLRVEVTDGVGSGVVVREDLLITNWHVTRGHDRVAVVATNGRFLGRVVATSDMWDLSAVRVAIKDAKAVRLAARMPRPRDRLTLGGHGAPGQGYRELTGSLVGYASPVGSSSHELIEMRGLARHGDSGGAIFNANGELAGLIIGIGDGRTLGVGASRIGAFLEDVE
jgi:serine protease Do